MWNNSGDLTADFGFSPECFACVCLNCDNDAASTAPYRSDGAGKCKRYCAYKWIS